jgi:hypothetical protein
MKLHLFLIAAFGLMAVAQVSGQPPETARQRQDRINEQRRIDDDERRIKDQSKERSADFLENNRRDAIESRAKRNNVYQPLSKKESLRILKDLEPNPEDKARYEAFLKQDKTGLFRLTPNHNCTEKLIVRVGKECERSTYIGEYYTFALPSYGNRDIFDLTYKDGYLLSKGVLSQGIITEIGDVSLKNVDSSSKNIKYLLDFVPQTENKEVKKQSAAIAAGIDLDGYTYSRSAKAAINGTYALRVISYRFGRNVFDRYKKYEQTALDSKSINIAGISERKGRADVTIIFRIVRQDTDGSLIILWKEIARRKAPMITFKDDEPLSEI